MRGTSNNQLLTFSKFSGTALENLFEKVSCTLKFPTTLGKMNIRETQLANINQSIDRSIDRSIKQAINSLVFLDNSTAVQSKQVG